MDPYLHTAIAGICLMVAYYSGMYLGSMRGKIVGIATCVFVMSKRLTDTQLEQFMKDLSAMEE